jgi:hypothetical protein
LHGNWSACSLILSWQTRPRRRCRCDRTRGHWLRTHSKWRSDRNGGRRARLS